MGRPDWWLDLYEVQATWRIRGDDKDVEQENEWIEEQLAIRNVANVHVTFQKLHHAADPDLSNSGDWVNE
jgi:hypothetical protein